MRVLLINSHMGRSQPSVFPLGLGYLASVLKDHQVVCFDPNLAEEPFLELTRVIAESDPEVIGLSLRNIDTLASYDKFSYWPSFVKMVKYIRGKCPDAVLVVGGSGFSLFAEQVMVQLPEVDFGIYLEGEESFPELLGCLEHKEDVKGVYYRVDGKVQFTGEREFMDLDSLPAPRRDILDLSSYEHQFGIGVQTKRGCIYDCVYCTYPFLTGHELRLRSPKKVGEEIETLCREYNVKSLFFSDNVFNWPLAHAEAICQEILRRGLDIRWIAYFTEEGITADFVKLCLECGCVKFTFAPDGSNDAALKSLGKALNREQLEATYRLLVESQNARFECGFLWNYPQVRWRDLLDLFAFAIRLIKTKRLSGLSISTMRILPNTRLHAVAVAEKRIRPDDNLIMPTYYDPFPGNLISVLTDNLGKILRGVKIRRGKPIFSQS